MKKKINHIKCISCGEFYPDKIENKETENCPFCGCRTPDHNGNNIILSLPVQLLEPYDDDPEELTTHIEIQFGIESEIPYLPSVSKIYFKHNPQTFLNLFVTYNYYTKDKVYINPDWDIKFKVSSSIDYDGSMYPDTSIDGSDKVFLSLIPEATLKDPSKFNQVQYITRHFSLGFHRISNIINILKVLKENNIEFYFDLKTFAKIKNNINELENELKENFKEEFLLDYINLIGDDINGV